MSLYKVLELIDAGLIDDDFELLKDEDDAQIKKWGYGCRTLFEWLAYITEEVGELSQAMSEYIYRNSNPDAIAKEAVQVATLALKVAVMAKKQLR